jgi:hypothetical protein
MDTFKNFAIAQVITPPSPPLSGASLTITPGSGAYMPPVPFTITVFDGAAYATPINAELIRVTAIIGDTLSGLIRAVEGSTARTIRAGDYVAQTFTAQLVADLTNSDNQSAGTLPDARLSANVALRNASNVFTQPQLVQTASPSVVLIDTTEPVDARRFNLLNTTQVLALQAVNDANTVQQGSVTMDRLGTLTVRALVTQAEQVIGGTPAIALIDTSAPVDARRFNLINTSQLFALQAVNDANSVQQGAVTITRFGSVLVGGDLFEKGRATPIGHWIDVPYSAANFGATGGTWTVSSLNAVRLAYTLIGKTALIQLWIDGSVVGGAPSSLNVVMPFTILSAQSAPCYFYVAPDLGWGIYSQPSQDQYIRLQRDPFLTPFAAASDVRIRFSAAVQIL